MSEIFRSGETFTVDEWVQHPTGAYRVPGQISRETIVVRPGLRLRIDGVECIVVGFEPEGFTTRPVTDAD